MIVAVMLAVFLGLAYLGSPIAVSLGLSSLVAVWLLDMNPVLVIQQMFEGLDVFPLLAVPFFLMVGEIMNTGNVTERLTNFTDVLMGHVRGGLAHVTVVVSMIMAGISGSITADTAAVGTVMIPAMYKQGYPKAFTVALTCSASTMGAIIPPSILMVVYGAMGGVSIAALFFGGAIPGMLIGLAQMGLIAYMAKKHDWPKRSFPGMAEVKAATKSASLTLLIPAIIMGGIIGGLFTPTEAAMIATVYALFLAMFIYRTIKGTDMFTIFGRAVVGYSAPLLCVATASAFGWLLAVLKVPDMVLELAGPVIGQPIPTLIFITVLLVIVGDFLDPLPAIIIFLPILQKMGAAAGVHPIHLGVIVTMNMSFGLITPPYGIGLLLASAIGKIPFKDAFKAMWPFYFAFLAIVLLCIVFPELVLFVPKLVVPSFM